MTCWKPGLIVLVTVLAGVGQVALPALRPFTVGIFLLFCPGAALLGFLRLDAVTELVLSVALSLVVVTLTAEVAVLTNLWSLEENLWLLFVLSVQGALLQMMRGCQPRGAR